MKNSISSDLHNRFKSVIFDGLWIAGTNYKQVLELVDYKTAIQKVKNRNSIASLTYHVTYYIKGLNVVFNGGELVIKDQFSYDVPKLQHEQDWQLLKESLWLEGEQFAEHIRKMSNKTLSSTFVEEKYGSYQRNIEAQIEHAYYHLGQIVLLLKILQEEE